MKILFVFVALLAICNAEFDYSKQLAKQALENPNMYGGDMLDINGPEDLADRAGKVGDQYRWPGGVLYYSVDKSSATYEPYIQRAIAEYHNKTCIRIKRRTHHQKDYVHIFHGKGCYSSVGRIGGKQKMSLGDGCFWEGTIMHEFGHALGFFHEQTRSDRDEHLHIYMENVKPGKENNFSKNRPDENILYNEFDYDSIMIYGSNAFSKNGKHTMKARNGRKITNPYDKEGLSESDIYRVRKMYKCDEVEEDSNEE